MSHAYHDTVDRYESDDYRTDTCAMPTTLTVRQRDIADEHAGDYEKDEDRLPTRWELTERLSERAREENGPLDHELLGTAKALEAGAPFARLSECLHDGKMWDDTDDAGQPILICAMCKTVLMLDVDLA